MTVSPAKKLYRGVERSLLNRRLHPGAGGRVWVSFSHRQVLDDDGDDDDIDDYLDKYDHIEDLAKTYTSRPEAEEN